jgi:hypothetical protein
MELNPVPSFTALPKPQKHNLKPYNYFEYLLTEIPMHLDEKDRIFFEELLPWSPKLPAECKNNLKLRRTLERRVFTGAPPIYRLLRMRHIMCAVR